MDFSWCEVARIAAGVGTGTDIGARGVQDARSARVMSATTRNEDWWKWKAPGMKSNTLIIRPAPTNTNTNLRFTSNDLTARRSIPES